MAELYRSKEGKHPVEVNQLTAETAVAVAAWCGGTLVQEHDALQHDITFAAINLPTRYGVKRAQEGDFIVRFPTGEFYPAKPHQFDELFEAVVDG